MADLVLVLTTLPADFAVAPLAEALVEGRLAACVTLLPVVESIYRWEGRVQTDRERQLVIKTTRDRVNDLWAALRARHPYDVPEFLVLTATSANPDYEEWVFRGVKA